MARVYKCEITSTVNARDGVGWYLRFAEVVTLNGVEMVKVGEKVYVDERDEWHASEFDAMDAIAADIIERGELLLRQAEKLREESAIKRAKEVVAT
jgi:hypothetical protein